MYRSSENASLVLLYVTLFWFRLCHTQTEWNLNLKNLDQSYLKRYESSKYRNHSIINLVPILQNKRIMFVGDSLTRYQYLNLIRYLHSGRWTEPFAMQLCCEHSFKDWGDFFTEISASFGCNHICDCHHWDVYKKPGNIGTQENHYYYDADLNLTISSHLWYGVVPIWMDKYYKMPTYDEFANHCHENLTSFSSTDQFIATDFPTHTEYSDIFVFLEKVVKPSRIDVLMMNFGHWEGSMRHWNEVKKEIKIKQLGDLSTSFVPLVIWKTTTARLDHEQMDDPGFLQMLTRNCPKIQIFDAFNMTKDMEHYKGVMWDNLHFISFVYRELNIAFLEHLETWWSPSP